MEEWVQPSPVRGWAIWCWAPTTSTFSCRHRLWPTPSNEPDFESPGPVLRGSWPPRLVCRLHWWGWPLALITNQMLRIGNIYLCNNDYFWVLSNLDFHFGYVPYGLFLTIRREVNKWRLWAVYYYPVALSYFSTRIFWAKYAALMTIEV